MNRTRTWSIIRQTIRRSDSQTRWDQAYQYLLQWTVDREGAQAPLAPQKEVPDACCRLRPCLEQPPSPSADHLRISLNGCVPTLPASEKRWMSTTSCAVPAAAARA